MIFGVVKLGYLLLAIYVFTYAVIQNPYTPHKMIQKNHFSLLVKLCLHLLVPLSITSILAFAV